MKKTLLDFQDEIENIHPFVTFIIKAGTLIISHVTMPWCRFRSYNESIGIYEVRSCDCEGEICGHPPQRMYMDKQALEHYVLTDRNSEIHLKFTCEVNL